MMDQLVKIFLFLIILSGCKDKQELRDPLDKKLAQVGPKSLYASELEGMVTEGMTVADSALTVNAYIERWTRDQVLLLEAEKNLSPDLNLNALVEDYRSSLLRLNYEDAILASKLDSTISNEELQSFYDQNKEQYQLEKPILRCLFMQIPTPVPSEREIQGQWNRLKPEDLTSLSTYATQYAESYLLSDSTWHTLDEISELIPSDIVNSKNINSNTDWTLKAKNFKYYLKVLEMKSRKDIAPLSFIQEQAARAVLYRRKLKIIDTWRNELYQKALAENRVKIFTY